jgi:hypothetical protein
MIRGLRLTEPLIQDRPPRNLPQRFAAVKKPMCRLTIFPFFRQVVWLTIGWKEESIIYYSDRLLAEMPWPDRPESYSVPRK